MLPFIFIRSDLPLTDTQEEQLPLKLMRSDGSLSDSQEDQRTKPFMISTHIFHKIYPSKCKYVLVSSLLCVSKMNIFELRDQTTNPSILRIIHQLIDNENYL